MIRRSDLSEISLRIAREIPESKIRNRELRRLDCLVVDPSISFSSEELEKKKDNEPIDTVKTLHGEMKIFVSPKYPKKFVACYKGIIIYGIDCYEIDPPTGILWKKGNIIAQITTLDSEEKRKKGTRDGWRVI
ncbi:MAG: hypothetical protein AYK18_06970 [Theionarchaea archaeon DG-70]|nr:MAG: hypothetical protein AYK18_06970 [Theionarchaea archaeon DG-70]